MQISTFQDSVHGSRVKMELEVEMWNYQRKKIIMETENIKNASKTSIIGNKKDKTLEYAEWLESPESYFVLVFPNMNASN